MSDAESKTPRLGHPPRRRMPRSWCVIVADKIVARYAYEHRARSEMDRMRRSATRDRDAFRVAFQPAKGVRRG